MRKKTSIVLIMTLLLNLFIANVAFSKSIDLRYMDKVFDKIRESSDATKSLYTDILYGAFDNDENLDKLAGNLTGYIDDEDLEKLHNAGIDDSEIKDGIKALKTWSYDDRMALIDYGVMEDQEKGKKKIEELNEKNKEEVVEEEEEIPTAGGGGFSTDEETPMKKKLKNKGLIVSNIKAKTNKKEFKDMNKHWSKESVDFFTERGVINGRTESSFEPEGKIKEEEILKLLMSVVVQDESKISTENIEMTEEEQSKWYSKYLKQAKALQVISKDKKLKNLVSTKYPSRERIVQYFVSTLEALDLELSDSLSEYKGEFTDFNTIDPKYKEAMIIANNIGLVKGNPNGTLTPKKEINRAETTVMLKRFYDYILKEINKSKDV